MLLLAFGLYLAIDGDRWGDPFVAIGIGAVAIIAVVGGGVVVPAVKALAGLDPSLGRVRPRLPALPDGPRRFLGAVVAAHDLRDGGQTVLING